MRKLFRIAAPLALVIGLAGCGSSSGSGEGDGDGLTVMLSYKKSIYWLPMLIAQDQGYFEEEGVDVEFEETNGSGFVTQQLIAGNVPAGWAGAPDAAVAFSKDDNLRALMCNPPQNIFRIVVPEDSEIESVEDLADKTLGIAEAGGGEEPIVNASLEAAGLQRDADVRILPIGDAGPASLNAILQGQVDAYAGSYPDISTLTADGRLTTRDITPEQYNAIPGDCLVTTVEALEDEQVRDQLVGMARAWSRGAVFAAENPEAATTIACRVVPQECEDMDFATTYVKDTIDLSGIADATDTPFGYVDDSAWQTTFEVLTGSGAITGDPDAGTFAGGELAEQFAADYWDFDIATTQEEARNSDGN
ncbi:hypothetical protein BHE97_01575 [Aeromicrobium sp. PE09-221]|uniref:ABC transporter substrate-binding protein n=1 Tax=Aeromicrobium sp. PE09-221 TaxID=1898043 RepID=UPI000B6C5A94|nr:ABC transporter substrate-binding protein [Aeromicrobium sp. PE09-221]OUZ12429.1 hypothetical protein BHE97_01575 [Aeromicrobium sp. PE09-221]